MKTPGATRGGHPLNCPGCGLPKIQYPTRAQARRAARKYGRHRRTYQCGPWWHLTSAPATQAAFFRRIGRW